MVGLQAPGLQPRVAVTIQVEDAGIQAAFPQPLQLGPRQQREDLEGDLRIAVAVAPQQPGHLRHPEVGHRHPQADLADHPLTQRGEACPEPGAPVEQFLGLLVEGLARHRQPHAAGMAVEQPRVEILLQQPDLARQGRLGDMHAAAGGGDGALLDHGDEVVQLTEFHGNSNTWMAWMLSIIDTFAMGSRGG